MKKTPRLNEYKSYRMGPSNLFHRYRQGIHQKVINNLHKKITNNKAHQKSRKRKEKAFS